MTTLQEAHPAQARRWNLEAIRAQLGGASRVRYTLYVYLASRLLFFAIALIEFAVVNVFGSRTALAHVHSSLGTPLTHVSIGGELSNWDGYWYLQIASHWYGHHIPRHAGEYVTLGFMPLYSMVLWAVAEVTRIGFLGAGLLVSLICGAIATVLIGQLAEQWWGEERARRGILFWCFFPGTVVFSMVYTEGMTVALIAGCLILLSRRRWVWAGACAGLATAIAPVALSAIPVCLVAAWLELRRRGWHDPQARRALAAPLLAPLGAVGFAIFLWFWTGSPLADYSAQHVAWSESSTPLSIPHQVASFIRQTFISGFGGHGPGGIDLNVVQALCGTALLLLGLKLLWENRGRVPLVAWVWTLSVSVLALTSSGTPPQPRMLVVAFPATIAIGALISERAHRRAMAYAITACVVLTPITYVGLWLRP